VIAWCADWDFSPRFRPPTKMKFERLTFVRESHVLKTALAQQCFDHLVDAFVAHAVLADQVNAIGSLLPQEIEHLLGIDRYSS